MGTEQEVELQKHLERRLASLLEEFIEGLQSERDFSTTLAGWRTALRISDAVRLSLTSRRAIPLEGP